KPSDTFCFAALKTQNVPLLSGVRCTKHIIAHSQTIRSSLLLLFLSVHNKPYTNWELDIMSNAKTKLGITKYSIVTNSNDSVTL
ncbi:hypothetical protein CYD90_30605, partial [Klebsiella pneumoniae]